MAEKINIDDLNFIIKEFEELEKDSVYSEGLTTDISKVILSYTLSILKKVKKIVKENEDLRKVIKILKNDLDIIVNSYEYSGDNKIVSTIYAIESMNSLNYIYKNKYNLLKKYLYPKTKDQKKGRK